MCFCYHASLRTGHTCRRTVPLMKQQSVVTSTIRHTEVPALLEIYVTNTPSAEMLHPQNIASPYIFLKNLACLSDDLLMICQVFAVTCKIVYPWVPTHCCFIRVIIMRVLLFSWGCSYPSLRSTRKCGTCTYFNYIVPVAI